MLRVVAQADVARVNHALMADGRNHEHEHVARHDPVRDRFLEVLERLASQPLRPRFRMEDPRRHADAQRALRDALAGTVEQPAGARGHDPAEYRPRRVALLQIGRRRILRARGRRARRVEIRLRAESGGGVPAFGGAAAAAPSMAAPVAPGAPGSDAAVTGDAPSAATFCAAAWAAGASGAFAGSVRGESEETEEVPGRPAGEGVFSLMTMVWYVAHAYG